MSQVIEIKCKGAEELSYKELVRLQGELKILSEESYHKFRSNLIENGFTEPIAIWRDNGTNYILNGHQRLTTIKRMVENEHFTIGKIPISIVYANSMDEAKKKLLAMASEYGEITRDGLRDFLAGTTIDAAYFAEIANIRGMDIQGIFDELGHLQSQINQDEGNIDNLKVGSLDEIPGTANDVMSGLRLVQIFLSDAELEEFKVMTDLIKDKKNLHNITEVIQHCIREEYERNKN